MSTHSPLHLTNRPLLSSAVTSASYAKVKKNAALPLIAHHRPTLSTLSITTKPAPPPQDSTTSAGQIATVAAASRKIFVDSSNEHATMTIREKHRLSTTPAGRFGTGYSLISETASSSPVQSSLQHPSRLQFAVRSSTPPRVVTTSSSGNMVSAPSNGQSLPAEPALSTVTSSTSMLPTLVLTHQQGDPAVLTSSAQPNTPRGVAETPVPKMNSSSEFTGNMVPAITSTESNHSRLNKSQPCIDHPITDSVSPMASNLVVADHAAADDDDEEDVYTDFMHRLRKRRKKLITKQDFASSLYTLQLSLLVLSITVSSVVAVVHCVSVWRNWNKPRVVRIPARKPSTTSTMRTNRTNYDSRPSLASMGGTPASTAADAKKPQCRKAMDSLLTSPTAHIAAVSFTPCPDSDTSAESAGISSRPSNRSLSITSLKETVEISQV